MLIDSNKIHHHITCLMSDVEESELNFSAYKVVMNYLKQIKNIVHELEDEQRIKNEEKRYTYAVEGLEEK